MNRQKPASHTRAKMQAVLFLRPRYTGPKTRAVEDAKMGGDIIATIWRRHQVGIFQLQQKHIRDYWYRHTQHLDARGKAQYLAALQRMLQVLGKDHWRY